MTRLGPSEGFVVIPANVAAMLHHVGDLRRLRARNQYNPLPEVAEFFADLDIVTESYRAGRASVTKDRGLAESLPSSLMSVAEVAAELVVEESAVRRAIREERLRVVSERPYRISRAALAEYRPRRSHRAHTEHTAAHEAQDSAAE